MKYSLIYPKLKIQTAQVCVMTTKLSENEQCLMWFLHAREKDMLCLLHIQYMAGLLPGIFRSKSDEGEYSRKTGFSDDA